MSDLMGMVRHSDHATSIAAAATVRRVTLRQCVLDIAERAGRVGVTDDELKIAHPDTPESSVRKRRTELAQENVLLDTGRTRLNRHGQAEAVWVLRDFHPCPPPVLNRTQAMSKDNQIATLQARVRGLECAMRQAIHEAEGSGGASFAAIKMTDILTAAL